MNTRPPLALIAGPTASGKSAAAIALAERTGGVIVNADSAQVYRDLRILTARPTIAEEARVPHRLFGYIDGAEACSAARWAADAKAEVTAAHDDGRLPILAGGTGLYIRTLLDGIAEVPPIPDEVRAEVRALPPADIRAALSREDPPAAARLHPNDTARLARALEVVRATGRPLADWQHDRTGGIAATVDLRAVVLSPPREDLYRRCDARAKNMVKDGAVDEVATLLTRRLSDQLPIMRAIGVRSLTSYLEGRISIEQAIEFTQQDTRNYAKRQTTWLRHQVNEEWLRAPIWNDLCFDLFELTSDRH